MEDKTEKPDVESIIAELRRGMDNTDLPPDSPPDTGPRKKLKSSLRKAAETADVMGRTGGSLRGKLCRLLSWFAVPLIEQINLHNKAVLDALNQIHNYQKEDLEMRIEKLKAEISELKQEKNR